MSAAEPAQHFDARRKLAGTRLGRYLVGPRLGSGGTASVYLARVSGTTDDSGLVALKVVHEHLHDEQEFVAQFLDEANLLVRLHHRNIVRVLELNRDGETLFLAMEYLDGQPLSNVIHALARRNRCLPPDLVAWIGARTAEGLAYAHRLTDEAGQPLMLVHRDVSPQNIFLTSSGQVKLIDFGIARAVGRIAQTTLGKVKGKFSYMAPEQFLGKDFDHRVDQFALGATLYEAAVGSRLFSGIDESETLQKLLFEDIPDPRDRLPEFPAELAEVLQRTLQSEAEQRFASSAEMAQALDQFYAQHSQGDAPARVHQLLEELFAHQRDERASAMHELSLVEESDVASTADAIATYRPSGTRLMPGSARWVWLAGAGALLVVLFGGAVLALLAVSKQPSAPVASATPASVPTTVTFEVTVRPSKNVEVLVAGKRAAGDPAKATLPRGEQAVDIVARAPGYHEARLSLVPDRDRSLFIPLTELPKPAPSASAPPEPSKKPPRSGGHGSDPLVTDYPW